MNLLIISNNLNRASYRQRIGIHLDSLNENGINCEVSKLPHGLLQRRELFKKTADFDAVFLHKKCLNFRDAFWLRRYAKKITYDFDDAVMYSPKTPASDRSSHFRLFTRTAKMADVVIAGNSYLAQHALKFNPNVEILPTGLELKAYKAEHKPESDGRIRIVWIGSESTLPYLENIKAALEEIGSQFKNVVLRIICDEFFDLQNMQVEKLQWSLETQYQDLVASDIGLAPLPDDRFTRGKCGFKILQYQAANLPVVASPIGINAEYVSHGITGYHASDIQQWVDKVAELIENAGLRKQMGTKGRNHAEQFDTNIIGTKLCSLFAKYLEAPLYTKKEIVTFTPQTGKLSASSKKTVSICIPTYNRREYLKETIDSILAQTYKDYEIVIVDDGSTDGTEDVIKKIGLPVTYYWQPNAGEPAARNKLLELAKGEFITFIDSDDLLFPYAIEQLLETVYEHGPDVIAYGTYIRIDEKGRKLKRKKRKLPSGNITAELFDRICVHSCGTMCEKKILQQFRGFDASLPVCSPYVLWLKLSLKYKFVPVEKPLFKRRRHDGNLSERKYANMKTEFDVLEKFYYNDGGNNVISQQRAMKRLGREGYRAARCAIREGLYDQAYLLLTKSFKRHPNLKSLMYLTSAVISKKLA